MHQGHLIQSAFLLRREMLTTTKMDAHKGSEVNMGNSTPEHFACSESEQLLELQAAALKAAPNSIVITDREAKIVWVNNAFEQLSGYSSQEVVGQSTRVLQSGKHSPAFYKNLWDTILSGSRWQGGLVNRRKDGTLYSEEISITPIRDGQHHIEEDKIGNVLASDTKTLFPVPSVDNTVPSLDEYPFICNPLELAVFDQEYLHFLRLVNLVLMCSFKRACHTRVCRGEADTGGHVQPQRVRSLSSPLECDGSRSRC